MLKEKVQPSMRCEMLLNTLVVPLKHCVCVCLCVFVMLAGGHPAVRRGGRSRVVAAEVPEHAGGGGSCQEHQQAGGTGDSYGVCHPHGLVSRR